jgi:hypothetical protein
VARGRRGKDDRKQNTLAPLVAILWYRVALSNRRACLLLRKGKDFLKLKLQFLRILKRASPYGKSIFFIMAYEGVKGIVWPD